MHEFGPSGCSIRCTITVFRAWGLSGAPSGDGEGPGDEFRRSRETCNGSLGVQNCVPRRLQNPLRSKFQEMLLQSWQRQFEGPKLCPRVTPEALAEQISRDVASKLALKLSFGVGGSGRRPVSPPTPARGPACGVVKIVVDNMINNWLLIGHRRGGLVHRRVSIRLNEVLNPLHYYCVSCMGALGSAIGRRGGSGG